MGVMGVYGFLWVFFEFLSVYGYLWVSGCLWVFTVVHGSI